MQKTLNEHVDIEYPIIKPENKFLVEIANIFLSNNEFTFHGKSHRQIIGASMGAVAIRSPVSDMYDGWVFTKGSKK
jgi:hypothetical protein